MTPHCIPALLCVAALGLCAHGARAQGFTATVTINPQSPMSVTLSDPVDTPEACRVFAAHVLEDRAHQPGKAVASWTCAGRDGSLAADMTCRSFARSSGPEDGWDPLPVAETDADGEETRGWACRSMSAHG